MTMMQGKGDGVANPFVTIGKQWDKFHFMAYEGLRILSTQM